MQGNGWPRRAVVAAMAASAVGAGTARAQAVKWSAGEEKATLKAPPNATDCHHHIYDSRFPIDPHATLKPGDATVADYRALQRRIGTTRNVVVQPSTYGTDNRCTLDALAQFGAAARGVAVVDTSVTDDELHRLHAAGIRGIRFNLVQTGATTVEMVAPLAARIAPLGWHVQVHALSALIVGHATLWRDLPCQSVFDHMGHPRQPHGEQDPVVALLSDLARQGKAWVKLSGAYMETKVGPPSYADITPVARAYVAAAPERMVWGSDWPHPTEAVSHKPDDAILFDLLGAWVPDEATRTRILVDNPARLYGFPA
ncbi:MAG TPA: amidohydrolase family protein [Acetobacteraceae bacterium]|nr:amidohydrolase family protein [Acetobacteraceae bacterium]